MKDSLNEIKRKLSILNAMDKLEEYGQVANIKQPTVYSTGQIPSSTLSPDVTVKGFYQNAVIPSIMNTFKNGNELMDYGLEKIQENQWNPSGDLILKPENPPIKNIKQLLYPKMES